MLQKQFALRRSSGTGSSEEGQVSSITPEEEEAIRRSRLRAAASTSVKIAGLKISGRESYFNLLHQALLKNYNECRRIEPDLEPQLTDKEVESAAIAMEYRIFSTTTVITLYRRSMTLLTSQIKKDTEKFHLHAGFLETDPDPTPPPPLPDNAGFVKASEMLKANPAEPTSPSSPQPSSSEMSLSGKKRVSR